MKLRLLCSLLMSAVCGFSESALSGRVFDPQGNGVAGATVRLETPVGYALSVQSNAEGLHRFGSVPNGAYQSKAEAPGLVSAAEKLTLFDQVAMHNITLSNFALQRQSVVITASPIQPEMDMRNAEVFNRTLFTRDDQVLQQLNAGINAGQHEGGGKSLEIRRFGFNLDHGGVKAG